MSIARAIKVIRIPPHHRVTPSHCVGIAIVPIELIGSDAIVEWTSLTADEARHLAGNISEAADDAEDDERPHDSD